MDPSAIQGFFIQRVGAISLFAGTLNSFAAISITSFSVLASIMPSQVNLDANYKS
jgi:hypothetical protein